MTKDEYNKCVEQHADGVFRFLTKNLKDADTARSLVQSAFEKMWVKHEGIEAEKAKSYLFTSAYHLMIDELKYSQRFVNMEVVMSHTSETKSYENKEVKQMVNKAAAQLPEEQRSVLMLRDYEGYSYDEIAEITGLNLSQVKVYLFRARIFIKNYIGKMEAVL